MSYCLSCATKAFQKWKGWPAEGKQSSKNEQKDSIPMLLEMIEGFCPVCRSSESLQPDLVYYLNIHGSGNTGLPDYFILKIAKDKNDPTLAWSHGRFGRPY